MMENLWTALSGERVTDLGMQKSGVDVQMPGSDGQPVYVDEKIKCKRSISEPMFPYTSVEVIQDADRTYLSGWWIKPGQKTDLYAYINLSSDNRDFSTLRKSEIYAAEVLIFKKSELKRWQSAHVADDDELYRDAVEVSRSYSDRKDYYNYLNENTAHLKRSDGRTCGGQKPVNLVVGLDVLRGLPHSVRLLLMPGRPPRRLPRYTEKRRRS